MATGVGGEARAVGLRLSVMMFLQFFVWGAWYVTVGNYMGAHGMGDAVFWAYTVGPIAAIVSPLFLGMVADRFFPTQRVLGVMHLLGGAALLAAPSAAETGHVGLFIGVLLFHMLCYMPTLGLVNTLSFHNMTSAEKQFPLVRVFGTIGWIVAGLIIASATRELLPTAVDRDDPAAVQRAVALSPFFFYLAGGAGILLGLYCFTLPHTPAPSAGEKPTLGQMLGLDSLGLLRDRSYAVFIVCSFLLCVPLAAYYAYAPVYVGTIYPEDRVPFYMSFGQMSEIAFMLVMPLMFARLGVKWMLLIGMAAWVVRYGLFAGAADEQIRWMVLTGIVLHGICYDFFFVTGQVYVDRRAPARIRGQAQGFLVLATQGAGMLVGAQVIGAIVNTRTEEVDGALVRDWGWIWLIPCIAAGIVAVAFFLLFREPRRTPPGAPEPGITPGGPTPG